MVQENLNCHFCNKRIAADDFAVVKELFGPPYPDPKSKFLKNIEQTLVSESEKQGIRTKTYHIKSTHVSWHKEKVRIPCCVNCGKKNKRILLLVNVGLIIGLFMFLVVLPLMILFLLNKVSMIWMQLSLLILGLLILLWVLGENLRYFLINRKAKKFSRIRELLALDYEFIKDWGGGDRPGGVYRDITRTGSEYPELSRYR